MEIERSSEMRATRFLSSVCIALSLCGAAAAGCASGDSGSRAKVDEAVGLIGSSQTLLEDLLELDGRFNTLGTRFTDVEDTIAEGKSLAETAVIDVDELESRYTRARDLLREVADTEGSGAYAEYARLILVAVEKELEAMDRNRKLLATVWDMLDVLPLAQDQEQLSYYVQEIDRLTAEISGLMQEGAEAAGKADGYREERGL